MPKEEMVNRFEEKFEQVKLRAILTVSALNKARTEEEKNVLYKEVKALFDIIQNFNDLEKIEFYKWFLQPGECDNEFEFINIENIESDMQSALEVARFNFDLHYSSILNKLITNLYQDYIKTDDKEEFVIGFLNLFIECRDLLEEENIKKDVKLLDLDDAEFKKLVFLMSTIWVGIFIYLYASNGNLFLSIKKSKLLN